MSPVLSTDTRSGVLNPLEIKQEGIDAESTGLIHARTDTQPVVQSNLTLDTENGWMSNQVEVNVSSLSRVYALNGTFDKGTPGNNSEPSGSVTNYPLGWDARSLNDEPSKQTIYAGYSQSSRRYIQLAIFSFGPRVNQRGSLTSSSSTRTRMSTGTRKSSIAVLKQISCSASTISTEKAQLAHNVKTIST
jgi:hypothetical protein